MAKKVTVIKPDEHVFIAGRTGSGKTFLAKKYLPGYENVVVLDTKGLVSWPEIPGTKWTGRKNHILVDGAGKLTLVTKLADLEGVETSKIIYRPDFNELTQEYFNAFFKWIYQRQNTICWIDEAMSVSPSPHTIPEFYKAILTRGRERNTAVWSLTQRPSGIAALIMSESTHFFVFDLNMPQDRDKLTDVTGAKQFLEKPGKYKFWYYHVEWEDAVKAQLVERR